MRKPSATIDEHAVRAAGGEVLQGREGIRIGGWTVETASSSITPDSELEQLKDRLEVLAAPEQFFGGNSLVLRHEPSGVALRFDALGALQGWVEDRSERVEIVDAELWQRSRQRDMQETGAQRLEYDWTFTTSYTGALERQTPQPDSAEAQQPQQALDGPTPISISGATAAAAAGGSSGGAAAAAAAAPLPQWAPTQEQMNRALLTSRDPILLFADLPLFESELEDHGASQVSVKVRVMPRCWYVLLRFWLRVDHVLVRLRETRLFCQFDSPERAGVVLREVKHSEGTFAELRAGGAPPEGPAYADGDSAASALAAVAPVGVKLFRLERLQL